MGQQPQNTSTAEASPVLAIMVMLAMMAALLIVGLGQLNGDPAGAPDDEAPAVAEAAPTLTPIPTWTPEPTEAPAAELDPARIRAGESVYSGTCAACHGFDARGIPGLGDSMVDNPFINDLSDADLAAFIIEGRPSYHPDNVTGIAMPARGGNPSLSDDAIDDLVIYIRSLNPDASPPTSGDAPSAPEVAEAPDAVDTTDEIDEIEPAAPAEPREPREFVLPSLDMLDLPEREPREQTGLDPFFTSGETAYNMSCAGCHGLDGGGVEFIAGPLSESDLIADRDGIGLQEYLTRAEPPVNPEEAFPHPYRGGYPQLTDEQIRNVIAYLYQLVNGE